MVGLEDVLDFQLFLHKATDSKVDGKRHRFLVTSSKEMNMYMSQLAQFGRISASGGKHRVPQVKEITVHGDRVYVAGVGQEETPLTLVSEFMKIELHHDPRKSYVKLVSVPDCYGRSCYDTNARECHEILFYPSHSLVPALVKAGVGSKGEPEELVVKADLLLGVEKKLERLYDNFGRRYPHAVLSAHEMKDMPNKLSGKRNAILTLYVISPYRPHDEKKEVFIHDWLVRNIPFPYVMNNWCVSSKEPVMHYTYFDIMFYLPKA